LLIVLCSVRLDALHGRFTWHDVCDQTLDSYVRMVLQPLCSHFTELGRPVIE
jgi:hypothetical protein